MIKVALAGNPNSGKTTLFNSLTGSTAHVGNWPGVTVDKREGIYKKSKEPIDIVDLPGIYSLSPYTPEEVISRDYILKEKPNCIINIVDATNLERNLYLTTQLMEIDIPIVIALNMMDEIEKKGDFIDISKLEKKLGVPVIEISALKEKNLDLLMQKVYQQSKLKRIGKTVLEESKLNHLINDIKIAFKGKKIENPLFHAIKLVEMDEIEVKEHSDLVSIVNDFKSNFNDDIFGKDFEAIVADCRYKYISQNFSQIIIKTDTNEHLTKSDKIDKLLTNKFFGIPIFLLILFLVFHLTFSEDLFFLSGILPDGFLKLPGTPFEGVFGDGSIYSPGVILTNLLSLFLDSISNIMSNLLSGSKPWVNAFVIDGVLSGLFAVLGFVPQILILFLFFSILEDSGYMARVAFILDRIFRKFGLSGRAFMPMIMGFGCSLPATINTRTLADENERTATIRVIPFFSCGAKLPILTAVSGGIIQYFQIGNADVITYSMYVIGILTAIISIIIMRSTTMRGEVPPFIMELPAYHRPQFKSLMIHLWDKLKHFIKKAFTIILVSTIIVWVLSSFSWKWEFLLEEIEYEGEMILVNLRTDESILGSIGMFLQPIFTPLGFGSQLSNFGWVFAVAAITGLIAKENVISTFGVLAACVAGGYIATEDGVAEVVTMIKATNITIAGLISFMAFNLTTIPCFAAVATAKAELPKNKFKTTILFWLVTSFIVGTIIYVVGTAWWSIFIVLTLFVATGFGIYYFNKYRDNKKLAGI